VQLTACHPRITVSADGTGIVSQAGGLLIPEDGEDQSLAAAWIAGRQNRPR
jgi:hypothetical protein